MKLTTTILILFVCLISGYGQSTISRTTDYADKEPPSGFEIMKWYWSGFPKDYNGWSVSVKDGWHLNGDTEGVISDIVNVACDTCGYLCKYSFDVYLTYGYDDKVELIVQQNKDSTNKYFKIHYPTYPYSIEECDCHNNEIKPQSK